MMEVIESKLKGVKVIKPLVFEITYFFHISEMWKMWKMWKCGKRRINVENQ